MFELKGKVITERYTADKTFTAETKEQAFIQLAKAQDYWYFSTNNGLVPRFVFDDKELDKEYYAWYSKQNPISFHRGIVD